MRDMKGKKGKGTSGGNMSGGIGVDLRRHRKSQISVRYMV